MLLQCVCVFIIVNVFIVLQVHVLYLCIALSMKCIM